MNILVIINKNVNYLLIGNSEYIEHCQIQVVNGNATERHGVGKPHFRFQLLPVLAQLNPLKLLNLLRFTY